jgi:hypothetical protein
MHIKRERHDAFGWRGRGGGGGGGGGAQGEEGVVAQDGKSLLDL